MGVKTTHKSLRTNRGNSSYFVKRPSSNLSEPRHALFADLSAIPVIKQRKKKKKKKKR